jgi:hypothetical protein
MDVRGALAWLAPGNGAGTKQLQELALPASRHQLSERFKQGLMMLQEAEALLPASALSSATCTGSVLAHCLSHL